MSGFAGRLEQVAALFGGAGVLNHGMTTQLDAHEVLLRGLPGAALTHLVASVASLRSGVSFEKALGMSLRTVQRRRESPDKPLSPEQSGRVWKFAEILTKATEVMGSQEDAEQWLEQPAMGLDRQRPIDLLATPAGVEIVETFLTRLEYGVYT